jgi:ATP-binding cassette subfamily B protein
MKISTTRQTLQLYWHHIWRYPTYAVGILLVVPLTILVEQFLPPIILANVIARLAKNEFVRHQVWASFGSSVLLYAGLLLLGSIGWRLIDAFNWRLEAGVERDIAQRIYNHLTQQSANFHANTFGGSLVSQTNKLMSSYIRFADTTIYQVIQLLASLVFTTIILMHRASLFVVLLLGFAAFYIFSSGFVTRKVRRLSSEQAASESRQTGYLADSITNIMAIKSFSGGHYERGQFSKITDNSHEATMAVMRASQKQMAYFSLLSRILSVTALLLAIASVVVFGSSIATAFLIFTYTSSLLSQLWMFCNNSLRNYNRAFGDASEMTKLLAVEPEVKDPIKPEISVIKRGRIAFNDVLFTHEGANETLFHGLNMKIKAGEKIGLVGHSGSGKTTFTRLLLRFSDIDSGAILIDGQNIAHITQDDLHRHIAYVPQEPIMFHRSLSENIRYGNQKATDAEVLKAAKVAHADEFIDKLPGKYDTLVGERGVKLSGGQRQRIAIARAMLKNAPILVLDEATSALDSESEVLIQDALWKLMEGRTAIVIAHRLSTVQKMDRIIVMEDGRITEQGTHKELIRENGTYAGLWAHQSGGFLDD